MQSTPSKWWPKIAYPWPWPEAMAWISFTLGYGWRVLQLAEIVPHKKKKCHFWHLFFFPLTSLKRNSFISSNVLLSNSQEVLPISITVTMIKWWTFAYSDAKGPFIY